MTFRSRHLHKQTIFSESEGLELNIRHTRRGKTGISVLFNRACSSSFRKCLPDEKCRQYASNYSTQPDEHTVFGLTSAIGYKTFLRMNPPQISKAAAARKSSLRYQVIKKPRKGCKKVRAES